MVKRIEKEINRMTKKIRDLNKTRDKLLSMQHTSIMKQRDYRRTRKAILEKNKENRKSWVSRGQKNEYYYLSRKGIKFRTEVLALTRIAHTQGSKIQTLVQEIKKVKHAIKDMQRHTAAVQKMTEVVSIHRVSDEEMHMRVRYLTYIRSTKKILKNDVDFSYYEGIWTKLGIINRDGKRKGDTEITKKKKIDKLNELSKWK
jgi:hypothetical protein